MLVQSISSEPKLITALPGLSVLGVRGGDDLYLVDASIHFSLPGFPPYCSVKS